MYFLLNRARTTEKIEKKVNEKMLENRDILTPVFKIALEVRKNKNTLVPDLETVSVMKKS